MFITVSRRNSEIFRLLVFPSVAQIMYIFGETYLNIIKNPNFVYSRVYKDAFSKEINAFSELIVQHTVLLIVIVH